MQIAITVISLGRSSVRRNILICAMLAIEQWKSFPNLNLALTWSRSTHSERLSPLTVTSTRFFSSLSSDALSALLYQLAIVFWRQGDPSAGLYIVKSGVLRASYELVDVVKDFEESTVAGMVPGEMSALSDAQEIRRWLPSIPRRCGSFVMKLSNSCKSKNRPW